MNMFSPFSVYMCRDLPRASVPAVWVKVKWRVSVCVCVRAYMRVTTSSRGENSHYAHVIKSWMTVTPQYLKYDWCRKQKYGGETWCVLKTHVLLSKSYFFKALTKNLYRNHNTITFKTRESICGGKKTTHKRWAQFERFYRSQFILLLVPITRRHFFSFVELAYHSGSLNWAFMISA